MDSMHFFDQYDNFFRSPGGAIEIPGSLRLRIKIKRGEAVAAWVICREDGGASQKMHMHFAGVVGEYDIYECELTFITPDLYWYSFKVETHSITITIPMHGDGFQVTAHAPQISPHWIQGGVIYHIFVDRFNKSDDVYIKPGNIYRADWDSTPYYLPDENGIVPNNDFFGGNLQGITDKLPYLKDLGVTCIYLSPVFEAASNHKYDTGDFRHIDPAFGGDAAFDKLCDTAKQHGMQIILDGVFNHVGVDSLYFNKYNNYDSVGAFQSKDSHYYSWFNFQDWPHKYDAWWGVKILPSINEKNPAYQNYICGEGGVISHWTRKGVAGWRLDVVDELPDTFLDPLCQSIKRENPSAYIVGEVWEDASNKVAYGTRRRYFQGGQLDSVTNYPLKDAIVAFVKDGDAPRLATIMDNLHQNYPAHVFHSLMNIIGTHDTVRILTVLGGDNFPNTKLEWEHFKLTDEQVALAKRRLKLAAALQFTLPGVPCVYYCDEAGMEGGADPFCRKCYPWYNEDKMLVSWYSILGGLRKRQPALKNGDYELVRASGGVFAFTRGQGDTKILVAVNVSAHDIMCHEPDFNFNLFTNEYCAKLIVAAGEAAVFAIK